MSEYRFVCLGLSDDWRTNKWRLFIPCGHSCDPRTTMLSVQTVTCPRCNHQFDVDYNNQTMEPAHV